MKNLLNKIVLIIAAFCLTATLFYNPADVYAASGSVTFGSESYEAENNSQFQIGVYLKGDSGMGSYHVELEYDNSRMDYVSGAESEANGVITMNCIFYSAPAILQRPAVPVMRMARPHPSGWKPKS